VEPSDSATISSSVPLGLHSGVGLGVGDGTLTVAEGVLDGVGKSEEVLSPPQAVTAIPPITATSHTLSLSRATSGRTPELTRIPATLVLHSLGSSARPWDSAGKEVHRISQMAGHGTGTRRRPEGGSTRTTGSGVLDHPDMGTVSRSLPSHPGPVVTWSPETRKQRLAVVRRSRRPVLGRDRGSAALDRDRGPRPKLEGRGSAFVGPGVRTRDERKSVMQAIGAALGDSSGGLATDAGRRVPRCRCTSST
jgi:hypothetical protein